MAWDHMLMLMWDPGQSVEVFQKPSSYGGNTAAMIFDYLYRFCILSGGWTFIPIPRMNAVQHAFIGVRGQVFLGQLGDGNVFYDIGKGVSVLKEKDDDFANLTTGMGNLRSFEEWTLKSFVLSDQSVKICLMTDGVSETLIEDRRKDFVELIWKRMFEKTNIVERNNMIYKLLREWNPINSGDDRTLVSYEKR